MNLSGTVVKSLFVASAIATLPVLAIAESGKAQSVVFGSSPRLFEDVMLTPTLVSDQTTVRGISGGPLPASEVAGREETVTGGCLGYVDTEPDHRITLTDFFDYLALEIQSPEDTTLVVRGPGGSWCSDDVYGYNPAIAGQWFSGTYDIWIGSYTANTYHPYVIRISERLPDYLIQP
ncbi:MAG: hypothetical protein VKL39_03075 [Leptolyngbyaceae bacterium]|nr:hypothetical protein [Leptolyngbyaceae bacterium]